MSGFRLVNAVALALVVVTGCSKGGMRVQDAQDQAASTVKTVAVLPLLNRTDDPTAPIVVGQALVDELEHQAPFKIVEPQEVTKRIAPLYESGMVGRLVLEVDDSGRATPEMARLVGDGLSTDAIMISTVTLYQQFVDRTGERPNSPTTMLAAECHLIDVRTGSELWHASKLRKSRGLFGGFPSYESTARDLASDLVNSLH